MFKKNDHIYLTDNIIGEPIQPLVQPFTGCGTCALYIPTNISYLLIIRLNRKEKERQHIVLTHLEEKKAAQNKKPINIPIERMIRQQ